MFDMQVVVFAEDINEAFAHITINTALDRIIVGGNTTLNLKEDIKEPFGIGIEVLPMGDKHIVANGLVAMVHRLLKSRDILG